MDDIYVLRQRGLMTERTAKLMNQVTNLGRRPGAAARLEPIVGMRRILFASIAGEPTAALRRAAALAELMGGELHVLRALPEQLPSSMLFPERLAREALYLVRLEVQQARRIRRWCATTLPRRVPPDRIRIRRGELGAVVAAFAAEIGCELIVLPGREGRNGALVTRLARQSRVPVMVARRPFVGECVVVASDLLDSRYPVLRQGGELAMRLEAPVTFVHNVLPLPPVVPMAYGMVVPTDDARTSEVLMAQQLELLKVLARRMGQDPETVVLSRRSTSDAILEVSRQREADIVVVGTRARSWLRRLTAPSVARRVVENAARSVLVVPLDRRAAE